jgi:hypothetical protein
MSDPTGIAGEKYVSLTTYKKDGTPKALPVWIVRLDDRRAAFTTPSDSWKAKRIANDPRVVLQPSNSRGVVTDGSTPVIGTAEVVTGERFEQVRALVKAEYGVMYHLTVVFAKARALLGSAAMLSDCAVVITLDEPGEGDRTGDPGNGDAATG